MSGACPGGEAAEKDLAAIDETKVSCCCWVFEVR